MKRIYLTREGYEKLRKELEYLKNSRERKLQRHWNMPDP
jgi:transcription elongation GreA/GreB family factor